MNSVVKKIAIFSMVGIMQIGFGASVIEASTLHNESPSIQQLDDRHDRGQDRYARERYEQRRYKRERIENKRHELAMERRQHESYGEWRERQHREDIRHKENMRRIACDILDLIFDS